MNEHENMVIIDVLACILFLNDNGAKTKTTAIVDTLTSLESQYYHNHGVCVILKYIKEQTNLLIHDGLLRDDETYGELMERFGISMNEAMGKTMRETCESMCQNCRTERHQQLSLFSNMNDGSIVGSNEWVAAFNATDSVLDCVEEMHKRRDFYKTLTENISVESDNVDILDFYKKCVAKHRQTSLKLHVKKVKTPKKSSPRGIANYKKQGSSEIIDKFHKVLAIDVKGELEAGILEQNSEKMIFLEVAGLNFVINPIGFDGEEVENFNIGTYGRIGVQKFLDYLMIIAAEGNLADPNIVVSLDRFMNDWGLSDEKEARKNINMYIAALKSAKFVDSVKPGHTEVYLYGGAQGIRNRVILFSFNPLIFKTLAAKTKKGTIMRYRYFPMKAMTANERYNPLTYSIGRALAKYKGLHGINFGESFNIEVKKIVNECPNFPTREQIGVKVKERLLDRFARQMGELYPDITWEYCSVPKTYDSFMDSVIKVTFNSQRGQQLIGKEVKQLDAKTHKTHKTQKIQQDSCNSVDITKDMWD